MPMHKVTKVRSARPGPMCLFRWSLVRTHCLLLGGRGGRHSLCFSSGRVPCEHGSAYVPLAFGGTYGSAPCVIVCRKEHTPQTIAAVTLAVEVPTLTVKTTAATSMMATHTVSTAPTARSQRK
eukprot:3770139-Prymnesium_polylepis.3